MTFSPWFLLLAQLPQLARRKSAVRPRLRFASSPGLLDPIRRASKRRLTREDQAAPLLMTPSVDHHTTPYFAAIALPNLADPGSA